MNANSYRASWLKLSESQQREVCKRFGLVFTHSGDHTLIDKAGECQQQEYDSAKLSREQLRKISKIGGTRK